MIGQVTRNLYHTHSPGSYEITGWLGWCRKDFTGNNENRTNGALTLYKDSYYTVADNSLKSTTSPSYAIWLDAKDGAGWTGSSGAAGTTEARPNNIALRYWKRRQ